MNTYTIATVSIRTISLFLIISLVVASFNYNNNPFSSFDIVHHHQTSLAIPNLQANNNTNISSSASNDTSSNVVPTVNHPPVVKVGPDQTVNESATVMLVGVAIDPDPNDKVSYSWMQIAGPAITLNGADTDTPSFTAPSNLPSDTSLKFTLTAIDDKGAESTIPATVTIIVKHINHPPVANANQDQTVNAGYVVSLDGTKSKDPNNDPINYSWIQTDGPNVTLNGANRNIATFTAPSSISADINLIFKLTVTDDKNSSSTDDVKVTVKYIPPPNQPPVADSGTDQTVNAGDTVALDGSASTDPDKDPITYSWVQTGGTPVTLNGADSSTPSFTAPKVSSDTQLKLSLTVKDDKGDISSPAIVTVTVKAAVPEAPTSPPSNMSTTSPSKEQYSFVRAWGSTGEGNGQFNYTDGIAIDSSGNVYVADLDNGRIQKFTSDGTFIIGWDSNGKENVQFSAPQGIGIDSQNNVYVADWGNNYIQKFTADGSFITKWGSEYLDSRTGQFHSPADIAIDSSNNVYVADWGNSRIQKFTADGSFITKWGSKGKGDGQFIAPRGIAIDSSNNVYVAEEYNDRIQKFKGDGTFITAWGSKGKGDGQFSSPEHIAVDSSGNVYVADSGNNRIQKFDSNGKFITKWGSEGSGEGQFIAPKGIAIDSQNNVYVADSGNNRIQVFAPSS